MNNNVTATTKKKRERTKQQARTRFLIARFHISERKAYQVAKAIEELLHVSRTNVVRIMFRNPKGEVEYTDVTLIGHEEECNQRVANKYIRLYDYATGKRRKMNATQKITVVKVRGN